ncbi:MAG: queuosine precursor transporter [Dokdonella sp.]|uniref:queuosine precursor transporter n=1 Tax=Dokdonella sp. TaxID=2291710 RepID=UPI003BB15D1E
MSSATAGIPAASAPRAQRMFLVLAGFFIANAIIAEFIGVKIFALEETLGLQPFEWNLFAQSGSLNFTAGTLLWPVVFIMTDIINEFYGRRGVRFLSWLVVGLIAYAFLFAYAAIALAPASWWVGAAKDNGVPDLQAAYAYVFGQGLWTIAGSITAFLVGQLIDVCIFHSIRKRTGERHIWMRATVSTFVSQFIDSFVVLYIAFVIGPQHWSTSLWLAVGTVNYCYKVLAAIALIPLIYLLRLGIDAWLGKDLAEQLKCEAARD